MNRDIFISHSSKDKAVADAVCAALEARDLRCWIAPRDIVPGTDWSAAIVDGLLASRATVLVFSDHSHASIQVRREVQFTLEQGRPLVPLRIDETFPEGALAYYLNPLHWLNAVTPPLEPHLDTLVKVVREMLDGSVTGHESRVASLENEDKPSGSDAVPAGLGTRDPRPATVGNVPTPMTPFIGREQQICAWQELLCRAETRLMTLVGFGGMGKSRSALELAARCMGPEFPEGVWWVELDEVTTREEMLARIADALGLEPAPGSAVRDQVAARLDRGLLLVLDNTEQIAEAGAVVAALLKAASQFTCLVTTRRALEIAAEHAVEVPPLPPEEAEALFMERAQARHAAFARTEANAADITELCRRLEGMPLALELAASRVAGMTPRDILARLDDCFRLLQTRAPDLPPRQRALTGAIEWSHNLLAEDEQALFAQLSVFARGFTLAAAEEVCDVFDVFESVHELRRHSFLRAETHAETQQMRFFMLEIVREYAARKLSGEDFRQRHAEFFLQFAEERAAQVRTPGEAQALAEMVVELDNLRAALEWSRQSVDHGETCARLALALHPVLYRRGFWSELQACLDAGLAAVGQAVSLPSTESGQADSLPQLRLALLRRHRGSLAHDRGDLATAHTELEAALQLYRAYGDAIGIAETLTLLGIIATEEKAWEEARSLIEEALALRPVEDHHGRGRSLHNLAWLASRREDLETARRLYDEGLAERRAAGDTRGAAETSGNLGAVAYKQGDIMEACRLYAESLTHYRSLGDRQGIALMLYNLGEIAEQDGDMDRAVLLFVHAERIFRDLQSPFAVAPAEALDRLSAAMGTDAFAAARQTAEQTNENAICFSSADDADRRR